MSAQTISEHQRLSAPVLDESAAAKYLGIAAETLRAWRRKGSGPRFFKMGGKLVRYSIEDLANFAASCARPPERELGARGVNG